MPIRDPDDAREVEDSFKRFFDAQAYERPGILRVLFSEILDFEREVGQLSLAAARQRAGIELPDAADRIASLQGIHVVYVAIAGIDSNRVRKSEVAAVAKLIRDQLGEDMLLLFSNAPTNQLHWIYPDFGSGSTPTLRRMVVERDLPRRTVVQQIANIYKRYQEPGVLLDTIKEAFDVEPVTKEFFRQYKAMFERAEGLITGFTDDEERKQFVQTLFNRLMFVYFLSRKGWLKYEGETDYLNALWNAHQEHPKHDNFYHHRLTYVFFEGLNKSDAVSRGMKEIIGDVPFLNGGLFEDDDLDQRAKAREVFVPDEAIQPLMTELFDKFNFTVMESTPLDIEVAVDPEMLGKVFEELVTGRHDSGAYYTPRPVVSFMCREALKGYLEAQQPDLDSDAVARFVDDHDASGISISQATAIQQTLEAVTVVDPACGSGAYLVGMMQELVDLRVELYNQKLRQDARSLYELKLHIIQRNLHGVDLDPFAVNIAMLRLWLSLAIEYEGDKPEPLPNLDFKIVEGDSLLGPDPSETGQQGVLGYDGNAVNELRVLKSRYMTESEPSRKTQLRGSITEAEATIREQLRHFAGADNALDWRIDFAEVIANGGFDIAVANPPYIQLQKDGGKLGNLYKPCGFETFARTGDIYQLFYERGCQLLQANGGLMAYITSNSWLRAEYGKRTRLFFSDRQRPQRWLDLGKDVFDSAIVDSGVLVLRTGGSASPFPSVDLDSLPDSDVPPVDEHWGETRPNGDSPWSVLSHIEWSVMEKMLTRGTPLRNWDVKINYGIKTGYNKAFIIDTATRDALIREDPKSAEIIKPILRGRDIQRFRAEWAEQWLINVPWHFPYQKDPTISGPSGKAERAFKKTFPAVHSYLVGHKQSLSARNKAETGIRYEWYALQRWGAKYHREFERDKLVWIDLADEGRFAYDDRAMYAVNTVYMLTGPAIKYLCAVLNSRLVTWFVNNTAVTSGMGTTRWFAYVVESIPVPKPTKEEQQPLIQGVDRILNENAPDIDAEQEIDRLVYDLYGLTEEEITAVEAQASKSRREGTST